MPKTPRTPGGSLESEIMEIIWQRGEISVRDVHELLGKKRSIAYTTVMTVMSRLEAKKLLRRKKSGVQYLYRPALSSQELVGNEIAGMLRRLVGDIGTPVLSRFVDAVGTSSPEKLDELARLIEEKRKRSKR